MDSPREAGVIEDVSDDTVHNFEWEIDDLPSHFGQEKKTYSIASPILQTNTCDFANERIAWKLRLDCSEKKMWVLYLHLQNATPVWASAKYSMTNNKNDHHDERSIGKHQFMLTEPRGFATFNPKKFSLGDDKSMPPDYKLTIHFTITIFKEAPSVVHPSRFGEFDDFEKMLADEKTADVTFHIGSEKLVAHKAVLSCRSPVFKAMFDHNMQEKITNEVHVNDVKANVMREVFRYIYTANLHDVGDMVPDLLAAADKYCLGGLKQKCVVTLFNQLSVNTVLQTIELADRYNDVKLRKAATEYLLSNIKVIVNKPEFQIFATTHPVVACEIVRAIVARYLWI